MANNEPIIPNEQLLREMIKLSNNSPITFGAAKLLTKNLSPLEVRSFIEWLRLAIRQQTNKTGGRNDIRFY